MHVTVTLENSLLPLIPGGHESVRQVTEVPITNTISLVILIYCNKIDILIYCSSGFRNGGNQSSNCTTALAVRSDRVLFSEL